MFVLIIESVAICVADSQTSRFNPNATMPSSPSSDMPYYDEIRMYAIRLTGDSAWADDLVQETYLRFLQVKVEIQPSAQRAWLYRTARNLFIDQFRRQKRTRKVKNVIKSDILPGLSQQPSSQPHHALEQEESYGEVFDAVDLLPDRQREVILLKFQQGLSYDEISQITGDTKTTIGWLLHEAITKLRKKLNNGEE